LLANSGIGTVARIASAQDSLATKLSNRRVIFSTVSADYADSYVFTGIEGS
jgi:hypothetical protein